MVFSDKEYSLPVLRIGQIEVKVPIIQGGMGVGISLTRLAAAVAKAGGIGIIAAVLCGLNEEGFFQDPTGVSLKALYSYVREAKEISGGAVGVNVMVASSDYAEYVKTAVGAGADLVICGAGLPRNLPDPVPENSGTAIVPIVSSARATELILKEWRHKYQRCADAVVLEGPMAGGHLGFKKKQIFDPDHALDKLLAEVLPVLENYGRVFGRTIPLVAAGGVYTGADIHRLISSGASGVQMGTRFVTTHECDASQAFKEAYLKAKEEDVIIIDSPVGLPGRAINNDFLNKVSKGLKQPVTCITNCLKGCSYPEIPYCISMALINAQQGRMKNGFAFCGTNACRADKVVSVAELIAELKNDYRLAAENSS